MRKGKDRKGRKRMAHVRLGFPRFLTHAWQISITSGKEGGERKKLFGMKRGRKETGKESVNKGREWKGKTRDLVIIIISDIFCKY